MRLANRTEIQKTEAKAAKSGVSEETLMESAGEAAAEWIHRKIPDLSSKTLAVIAGQGHNGADGLVVARKLASRAKQITVFCEESSRPLWKKQFKKLRDLKISVRSLRKFSGGFDLVVDALFGIGLNRNLDTESRRILQAVNASAKGGAFVLSLDVPSGLDCDRGISRGECVRAHHTLTFHRAKPGFFVNEGPAAVGRLHVLDIGLRPFEAASTSFTVSARWVRAHKPQFNEQIHKSDRGRSLLISGSAQYPGAGILSARAALRCGSGYVQLISDGANSASWDNPDFLVGDLGEFKLGVINPGGRAVKDLKFDAIGIGPGLGVGEKTRNLILELKKLKADNVVIDADAITVCSRERLFPLPAAWIATPHAGELGRVLKLDAATIESDRFRYAREGHEKMGCQVLLKGFHSVLATADKAIVIPTGNSALAKSGTGDVLTGMITSLMAQGMSPTRAALFGAYLHGWIADRWTAAGRDPAGMMASDIIANLPRALRWFAR